MSSHAQARRGLSADEVDTRIDAALSDTDPLDIVAPGSADEGTSGEAARVDHVHEHPIFASGDLHTEYQEEDEKGAAGGYCGLDGSQEVSATNAPAKAVYATGGAKALLPSDIGASNRWDKENIDTGSTTGATTADLCTTTVTDAACTFVRAVIAGHESTGPDGVGYSIEGAVKRDGGTVTQIGATSTPTTVEDAALAGAGVAFVIAGTSVVVRVTGVAGLTINWTARLETLEAP